jgi:hypothetical protein
MHFDFQDGQGATHGKRAGAGPARGKVPRGVGWDTGGHGIVCGQGSRRPDVACTEISETSWFTKGEERGRREGGGRKGDKEQSQEGPEKKGAEDIENL